MGKPNINVNVGGAKNDYPQTYKTKMLKPNLGFAEQVVDEDTIYVSVSPESFEKDDCTD